MIIENVRLSKMDPCLERRSLSSDLDRVVVQTVMSMKPEDEARSRPMCDCCGKDPIEQSIMLNLGGKDQWAEWPGGWPNEISTSLIDAVFSARARYTTKRGKGIKPLIDAWQASTSVTGSIQGLIAEIDDAGGPEAWADRMNHQWSPRRDSSQPGGPTKAAAVLEAAERLRDAHIDTAADVATNTSNSKGALGSVQGIGDATTEYFMMLLGHPGVKPDRMIHAFIKEATGTKLSNAQARERLTVIADHLKVEPTALDHAVWSWQRSQDGQASVAPSP